MPPPFHSSDLAAARLVVDTAAQMGLNRLRVVLALETSGPGGAENVVLRLASALQARGDDPIIATLQRGWMTERAQALGLPVWIAPQRAGVDLLWVVRFARAMRHARADVL